ncbi:CPBP family intramembrane glutamic endopeptidase [Nocardioides stalactiti]|uniref:CPBP family intramembrane glutamic endopeptidase n=1 Tax=Nocardioides stalactiti TaxID=2755356 RepID=UPI0015FF2428|nr:type II CAAX endopeptidase family protein [Nocardioides stalactiti]
MPSADGAGLPYERLHRLGRSGPGWALLGACGLVVGLFLLPVVLVLPVWSPSDPLTPAGLAMTCVALAAMTLVAAGLTVAIHHVPGRVLMSVLGRIRWAWLATCSGLAVVAVGATLVLASFLPEDGGGASLSGSVNDVTDRTVAFALIIVLLIPLQAAGEEFAFRGYLTQAVGGLAGGRVGTVLAVVLPALLFALAHGVQDPPVFIDRLAFGLVAGALVVATGGLEAGIAMHVLNNLVYFGLALVVGDISDALAPVEGTWWLLPGTLAQSLTYLVLVTWVARRREVERVTGQAVLDRQEPRV